MGKRSRKARSGASPAPAAKRPEPAPAATKRPEAAPARDDRMARGYARGRERDEAARAALEPLAPGERPLAVTIAALLATWIPVRRATRVQPTVALRSE